MARATKASTASKPKWLIPEAMALKREEECAATPNYARVIRIRLVKVLSASDIV
jgi:hypothetical protein